MANFDDPAPPESIVRRRNEEEKKDRSVDDVDHSVDGVGIADATITNGGHLAETKQKAGSKRESKTRRKRRTQRNDHKNKNNDNDGTLAEIATNTKKSAPMGRNYVSKRKRNGRLVRLVSLESKKDTKDEANAKPTSQTRTTSVPPLPGNQYATSLRRRAIRKLEDNVPSAGEDYGDISLGIKLIVAGGRVIVQSLNSLSDGLASPAQLAGVIQRGDVLLGIGNLSLINLPVDQLMEGLRPLSTPDSEGCYERTLHLRFEAGAGLDLLKRHEEEHVRSNGGAISDPMFSIFPMVDNLSGVHFYETNQDLDLYGNGISKEEDEEADMVEEAKDKFPGGDELVVARRMIEKGVDAFPRNLDSLISATLARERNSDRERYESEYFDWREDFPELLRRTIRFVTEVEDDDQINRLTNKERLELGLKIMEITKALELNIEEIDKGRDTHKNWSSGSSLRSSASATIKRQYNMDGTITSFRPSCDQIDEESIGSDGSFENVDPDIMLLGLAARDSVWRGQVISVLKNAIDDLEHYGEEKSRDSGARSGGMDFTQQFGFSLFRENSSRFPKHKMKSVSFPPMDITRVLFDLTTYIAAGAHDDFTAFDGSSRLSSNVSSLRSVTTKTGGRRRGSRRADIILATHFILDEALPLWLKSFKPLKLEERRILWPRQSSRVDLVPETYFKSIDNDNQTIDSVGSRSQISTAQSWRNDTREPADFEVGDNESRPQTETCFLVTYFYTQRIVGSDATEEKIMMNTRSFVETYGAYLQIQTCLSHAASVKDKGAIYAILEAARNDPSHQEAVREIQKTELVFYDMGKLSAVLQCLKDIRFEMKEERRNELQHLCVSGYPDIQPWQVRDACRSFPEPESKETRAHCLDDVMESLYYSYLSDLLDPFDGHEAARQNFDLVKEFCELSVGTQSTKESEAARMDNFVRIASRSSAVHENYRRDLMMLLDLNMTIGNQDLSLELVDEIFEDKELSSNKDALNRALGYLRSIGRIALEFCSDSSTETTGFEILRSIIRLFQKMACNPCDVRQKSISIPDELFSLFEQWKIITGSNGDDPKMYFLVDFVIKVSPAPGDVIRALLLWSAVNPVGSSLYSRIEDLLCRGIHFAALNGELSGTLFRLKYARETLKVQAENRDHSIESKTSATTGIWERMATGDLLIEK